MFLLLFTILFVIFLCKVLVNRGLTQKLKLSFSGATAWFNTPPLSLADLRGQIVLVDFWAHTCINSRRTLPHIREWAWKYRDQGLVVMGVHTPEFSCEPGAENNSRVIKEMNIGYPVAMDNNFEIWHSFQNQCWPALYLLDGTGQIRHQKFGEDDYHESELMIQKLLKEASEKKYSNKLLELTQKVLIPANLKALSISRKIMSTTVRVSAACLGRIKPLPGELEAAENLN